MEVKYRTRHEYTAKTGKRISKGAWERLTRTYTDVPAVDYMGRKLGGRYTRVRTS